MQPMQMLNSYVLSKESPSSALVCRFAVGSLFMRKRTFVKRCSDKCKVNFELQKVLILLLLPSDWSASDPVFFTVVSPVVKVTNNPSMT